MQSIFISLTYPFLLMLPFHITPVKLFLPYLQKNFTFIHKKMHVRTCFAALCVMQPKLVKGPPHFHTAEHCAVVKLYVLCVEC